MTSWVWIAIAVGVVLGFAAARWRRGENPYHDSLRRIEREARLGPPAAAPGELDEEIRALLRAGRKIEAIKRYRERHRVGLREAKDAVEGRGVAASRAAGAPGSSGRAGASLGWLAMLVAPLVFVPLFSPRAFSLFSTGTGLGVETLRGCPAAIERLGDGVDAAWLGMVDMESSSDFGGEGHGRYSFAVSGSRARGAYRFTTRKRDGVWRFESGRLSVDGAALAIPAECGARSGPG